MYEYLIQDEHGSIIYVADDKYHAKQIADVMTMKTGKLHFVDCVLATLCDHIPLTRTQSTPDQFVPDY